MKCYNIEKSPPPCCFIGKVTQVRCVMCMICTICSTTSTLRDGGRVWPMLLKNQKWIVSRSKIDNDKNCGEMIGTITSDADNSWQIQRWIVSRNQTDNDKNGGEMMGTLMPDVDNSSLPHLSFNSDPGINNDLSHCPSSHMPSPHALWCQIQQRRGISLWEMITRISNKLTLVP